MLAWFERLAGAALAAAGVAGGGCATPAGARVRGRARCRRRGREAALRREARRALEEIGA
jgi:hypothetical protein